MASAAPAPDASPERASTVFRSGNERLYEAYNDLHTLAQDFEKPFDAPAILVVGHQTDGKSGECEGGVWGSTMPTSVSNVTVPLLGVGASIPLSRRVPRDTGC